MATTIIRNNPTSSNSSDKAPVLIDRIDGIDSDVLSSVILPNEEGFISVNSDKTIRIWLKRETGKYWPSVAHHNEICGTCLFYDSVSKRLFVGFENGNITEFNVGEDYNKITMFKVYVAHQGRVTSVFFTPEHEWLLSTSRDKFFAYHSTKENESKRVGSYAATSWTTCSVYDLASKHCFVGDANGNITFLKLTDNGCEFKATLKGHESTIKCLAWDANKKFLFSGSYDKAIICWDIGGQKGITYDLEGHKDRVQGVVFISGSRQLISGAEDGKIIVWDMNAPRKETPKWTESDVCELCRMPFFWNYKLMWQLKVVGKRQHHCRRCGAAICDECSKSRSSIPVLGHEFQVRICNNCTNKISANETTSLATFHDSKHQILDMSYDATRKYLLTVGGDRAVKIWDMSSVV